MIFDYMRDTEEYACQCATRYKHRIVTTIPNRALTLVDRQVDTQARPFFVATSPGRIMSMPGETEIRTYTQRAQGNIGRAQARAPRINEEIGGC